MRLLALLCRLDDLASVHYYGTFAQDCLLKAIILCIPPFQMPILAVISVRCLVSICTVIFSLNAR